MAIRRHQESQDDKTLSLAHNLFVTLDVDDSGFISRTEIEDYLDTVPVQEFFRLIDVDVSEAQCLFDILDYSGDGEINLEEFLNGCLRLQGHARALDLMLMTRDARLAFA